MTKKYKVGDTIYVKGKVKQVDEDDEYPYSMVFNDSNYTDATDVWISDQAIVEPPAKPTLPKAVADELEQAKCDVKNFDWYIKRVVNANSDLHYYPQSANYWFSCDEESVTAILLNAWNNGYTVEKPKLYNLIFDDNFNGKIACLFKQPILDEIWAAYETSDINLKYDENYQFTQEEIDKFNKDFMIKNTNLNDYKVEVPTDEE